MSRTITQHDIRVLALAYHCEHCHALPGKQCMTYNDKPVPESHGKRVDPLFEAYAAGYEAARWERHP